MLNSKNFQTVRDIAKSFNRFYNYLNILWILSLSETCLSVAESSAVFFFLYKKKLLD